MKKKREKKKEEKTPLPVCRTLRSFKEQRISSSENGDERKIKKKKKKKKRKIEKDECAPECTRNLFIREVFGQIILSLSGITSRGGKIYDNNIFCFSNMDK